MIIRNCEFPYNEYTGYVYFHKKHKRRVMQLVHKEDYNTRLIINYARYLLSVKLGRELSKFEEVDHIDNNQLNDHIDNLQILMPEANNKKRIIDSHPHGTLARWQYCKCIFCKIAYNQWRRPRRKK